ncbi:MAG: hypothetical protein VYE40_07960 [Myxococcota bacterium]|nr:hypothetical protein [Myxococcota bacterium]MEC9441017.1 hypothetical protein [Myxococcota bacterium]
MNGVRDTGRGTNLTTVEEITEKRRVTGQGAFYGLGCQPFERIPDHTLCSNTGRCLELSGLLRDVIIMSACALDPGEA